MLEYLFKKAADPRACDSIKKRLQHRCFPVKFAKFLRTPFLKKGVPVAAPEVLLMFLKEFNNKYQIHLKNIFADFCCRENPEAATVGVL